jgi:predicted acetyltransferase
MALDLRTVGADDAEAWIRAVGAAFGHVADGEEVGTWLPFFDGEFALGVYDAGGIVATTGANRFELTLPAAPGVPNPQVEVAGVTAVGVLPTHRRRGLLTKLMSRQLADFKRAGVPLSILVASESVIYGRFGYGLGQSFQSITIERRAAAFRDVLRVPGRLRLVDADEASKLLPDLHEDVRRERPGEINRLRPWWDKFFRDRERDRGGAGPRTYVVHESRSGAVDGYVVYRQVTTWPDGLASNCIQVDDLAAATPAVHQALWRYLLDLDLSAEISARARPLDEPLRWMLADPRRLRTTRVSDHLWVRIVDVPAALAARGYCSEDRLVLEVSDAGRGAAATYTLEALPDRGVCRRSRKGEDPELSLSLADLGAVYLGGVAPSTLAAAGRVTELRPGAVARADRAFASPVAPFCSTDF